MPVLEVTEAADGELVINSGVTRATRVAKCFPGQLVRVEIIDRLPHWNVRKYPTVKDKFHPEWRVGQLFANVAVWARQPSEPHDTGIWDVEDDELLAALERHLTRREVRAG